MIRLTPLVLTLFGSIAMAESCPDLSGLYQMTEGAVLRYQSEACTRVIRWTGFTTKKGEIIMSPDKQVIYFDGTPICVQQRCQTAQVNESGVTFKLNYDGYVKTKDHGLCMHRQYQHSINSNQDLQAKYQVENCDDGFSGEVIKVFPRTALPDDL
ncbi:hypothetical protein [Bdellovibrio sp. HCB209]|uniref:hypothetical protein n=1 Tax=Bdellovibrio sp. HCB209 TaxID=3394354 RepID=UPI0039B69954